MKVSIAKLRELCPSLPQDPVQVRELLEVSGIECDAMVDEGDAGWVADVELLANRGDHRGYWGIAWELSARLGVAPVMPPLGAVPVSDESGGADFDEAALSFASLEFAGSGLHLVELANEVGTELGHPLHVFDADKLTLPLQVRRSRAGERADLIGQLGDIELDEGLLVVADAVSVVAIAGVLGCRHASADESTRRALVESACYDPVAVRVTASALGISTTASQRIERGGDQSLVVPALQRLVWAAEDRGIAKPAGSITVLHDTPPVERTITADPAGASRLLGADVPPADFEQRLRLLGFDEVSPDQWRVPSWRVWDVERPADLYEEYARAVGYDELPERTPRAGVGAPQTPEQVGRDAVTGVLHASGFYEMVSPGTYSPAAFERVAERLADDHPLRAHVQTLNAQASDDALLKNNCVVHALAALTENVRLGDNAVKLYEFTRLFSPDEAAENGVREHPVLWAVGFGPLDPWDWSGSTAAVDAHWLLGIAARCGEVLGRDFRSRQMPADHPMAELLHTYRQAVLIDHDQVVGWLGELHPDLAAAFDLGGHRAVVMQLSSAALVPTQAERARIAPAPPVVRMLDFVLTEVPAAEVAELLRRVAPEWCRDVWIADVFKAGEMSADELSVTFTLEFEPDQARRAEDVNEVAENMRSAVTTHFGADRIRVR